MRTYRREITELFNSKWKEIRENPLLLDRMLGAITRRRDRETFLYRHGLYGFPKTRVKDIAKNLRLTPERVSQIIWRAKREMVGWLRENRFLRTPSSTYTELITATIDNYRDELEPDILANNELLNRLNDELIKRLGEGDWDGADAAARRLTEINGD